MKKFTALLSIIIYLCTCYISVFALEYGSEWAGNEKSYNAMYSDVSSNHWAFENIARVSEKMWLSGYPDGSFRPEASITRAEAMTVFVKFLGLELNEVIESPYYDVDVSAWYAPYIQAGNDLFPIMPNIQGKLSFRPDMPILREDVIYALVKALGYDDLTTFADQSVLNMFEDKNSISSSLKSYVSVAVDKELVSGRSDGTIGAQDPLTRAEFATLLYRASFIGIRSNNSAKLQNIEISPSTKKTLNIGESFTVSAIASYSDNFTENYTNLNPYNADDNGVVTINQNTITAVNVGNCEIKFNDENLKDKSIIIIVEKPTDAPSIKLDSYSRETENDSIKISGQVSDSTDTELVLTCDGSNINMKSNGTFSVLLELDNGINEFELVAKNGYGNKTLKTIKIEKIEITDSSDSNIENSDNNNNDDNNVDNSEKPENDNNSIETDNNENNNSTSDNIESEKVEESKNMMEICPPYQTKYYKEFLQSEGKSFLMGGTKYSNGFRLAGKGAWALFNLNGKYSSIDFIIGHVDDSGMKDVIVTFIVDGSVAMEIEVKADELAKPISLPLNYASQLKVMTSDGLTYTYIGFGNIIANK